MTATSTIDLAALTDLSRGVDTSSTIAAIRGVIQEPTQNTTLSLVLLSVVIIAVVLLAVILLLFVTPPRRKIVKIRRYAGVRPPQAESDEEADAIASPPLSGPAARPPGRFYLALTGPAAVSVLVALALAGGYLATSTNIYCAATCHAGSESAQRADELAHASCVSCHESGPLNIAANVSSRARMLLYFTLERSTTETAVAVDSYACLRCHSGDIRDTSTSDAGVRMSHVEVTTGGRACTACHASSGHSAVRLSVGMSACLPCHDSRKASAECDTCHTKDPAAIAFVKRDSREPLGSGDLVYPAVRAANRDCGACHDQPKECDGCHGIRMPHTRGFKESGHARWAGFTGKLKCWKCHDPQWCSNGPCHQSAFSPTTGDTTHGRTWKRGHAEAAWNSGCVCHSGRSPRKAPICTLCHDPDTHALLPKRP